MSDGSTTIETGTEELLCSVRDRVAIITLNRPAARNSLSDSLTPALRRMIKQTGSDPDVGALLITGAGAAFCSGGDVKGMGGKSSTPPQNPKPSQSGSTTSSLMRSVFRFARCLGMVNISPDDKKVAALIEKQRTLTGALVSLRKPTIAALPGPAVGAGLAIALACDIRIASESAMMTTGYAKIALTGDYGISWLLTRLAGTARARELMFLSERIDARRCEALGLVNRVVPDADLQTEALAMARTLANGPASAFAAIKDNLDRALVVDFLTSLDHEAENIVTAIGTSQHAEAVRAFIEKRAPNFR